MTPSTGVTDTISTRRTRRECDEHADADADERAEDR